ncbi:MAG TPA: hypothetical protein VEJ41_10385, partial [Candidatus Acidoferrales bacterium]|nr:hypothetical protein [Candidatus Acidoferrales bacterium]
MRRCTAVAFTAAALFLALALGIGGAPQHAPAAVAAEVQLASWRPAQPNLATFVGNPDAGYSAEVDLRPQIRARGLHIRNQGNRGTCTVFATTFLIEYQKAGTPGQAPGLAL